MISALIVIARIFNAEITEIRRDRREDIKSTGGCLAAQYVAGWVIEKKADKEWKDLVLKSIQPVGEGLKFSDAPELLKLYGPSAKVSGV